MKDTAIIVFQKHAIAGHVKTRLAKTVGNQKALWIYKSMVLYTYQQLEKVKNNMDVHVFYDQGPALPDAYLEQYAFPHHIQEGADLGARMLHAFRKIQQLGYSRMLIIGTDCPELTEELLLEAQAVLATQDVVIGPSQDGGYYLLGLRDPLQYLFQDIPWSTEQVLPLTRQRANEKGLGLTLLAELNDIDTEEDWIAYRHHVVSGDIS